jgi:nucleoside-diphosphate-sugar epimerase
MKPRIAVFGASGFVGSSLCERLYFEGKFDFRAVVRSTGSAARLTRFPMDIRTVNVLDPGQVKETLKDCQIVVNCTRGDNATMLQGLDNIMRAAKSQGVEKFIHLSSMAIYGSEPPPGSSNEGFPPDPGSMEYGRIKLKQDEKVLAMHRNGLPSIILCPSNISGPYSYFVLGAVSRLKQNRILLVDEGKNPTNMIHVDNLVEAILVAAASDKGWGERYFVNESEPISWKRFYDDLAAILGVSADFQNVPKSALSMGSLAKQGGNGITDTLKILVSGEFRNSLSMFPAVKKANAFLYDSFNGLNPSMQKWFRRRLERPIRIGKKSEGPNLTDQYVLVQGREVYHSPRKLSQILGFQPILTYHRGMETTAQWIRFAESA